MTYLLAFAGAKDGSDDPIYFCRSSEIDALYTWLSSLPEGDDYAALKAFDDGEADNTEAISSALAMALVDYAPTGAALKLALLLAELIGVGDPDESVFVVPEDTEDVVPKTLKVRNAFCPTGKGGGVDPTCSPGASLPATEYGKAVADEVESHIKLSKAQKAKIAELNPRGVENGVLKVPKAISQDVAAELGRKMGARVERISMSVAEADALREQTEGTSETTKTIERLHEKISRMLRATEGNTGVLPMEEVSDFTLDNKNALMKAAVYDGLVKTSTMTKSELMYKVKVGHIEVQFEDGCEHETAVAVKHLTRLYADPETRKLAESVKNLVVTTQRNADDEYWAEKYKIKNFTSAAVGGGGQIVIHDKTIVSADTIAHEAGHNLASAVYDSPYPSDVKAKTPGATAYVEAQSKEPPVTDYGSKSVAEDFAEAAKLYVDDRNAFAKKFPHKHAAMKQILEGG